MKTIILSAALILGITATSCRKERVCECKSTETEVQSNGNTYVDNYSTKITKDKQNKKVFKNQYNCFSSKYSYNGERGIGPNAYTYVTTVEETCDLK